MLGRNGADRPTGEQVTEARDAAFEAVRHWLDLATSAGQSLPQIMRELSQMIKKP